MKKKKYYFIDKNGIRHETDMRQWKKWECDIMNIIDFRYWFCESHYYAPYGRVISADCEKHD